MACGVVEVVSTGTEEPGVGLTPIAATGTGKPGDGFTAVKALGKGTLEVAEVHLRWAPRISCVKCSVAVSHNPAVKL